MEDPLPLDDPMRDNYRWIRRLGGGSFGDVHLYQANNGEAIAIKFIAMGRSLTIQGVLTSPHTAPELLELPQ